jgi:hypothetical protein
MKAWPLLVKGDRDHDGWAIKIDGMLATWTTSTTREECRQIREERADIFNGEQLELFKRKVEIVKVRINIQYKECV